jgi:crotonobetainyl-CoA:carnitine CoA-transferase CaiB-like acyl-CoA transferase
VAQICEGWTVVEVGSGSTAACLAGMLLADNGARVIKVEPPAGDPLRTQSPSGFLVWNRGKESLVADLATDEGRTVVRDAALRADVLLAGVPAGKLEQWGLGENELRSANPALVIGEITGFGRHGAYAEIKAYEGVVAARAGVFARGDFGFRPGPIFYDAPWAALGAAHHAAAGILAALIVREETGRGQHVDATLVSGISALDYFGTMHWQHAKAKGEAGLVTISTSAPSMAATRTMMWMATKDSRFLTTTGMVPKEARALTRALGVEHILDDPRFANAPKFPTAQDAQDYEDLMWEALRTRTLDEWLPILRADLDIAFEAAVTSEEALEHPQIVHNRDVITVDDPVHGPVRMVGSLAEFRAAPSRIERLAPALGENAGALTGPAPVRRGAGAMPPYALAGVTIVECGYFFAMPFAVTLAAALGARAIKIEGKDGDPFRASFGDPETTAVRVMEGKESLSIDLQHPSGREVMHKLVATADIFVTSFRPGVPERLGLDYDTLRAINPRLVYVHAAGYGTDGPYSSRAMYATAASAAVGGMNRHAGSWLDPELTQAWGVMELQAVIKPRLAAPTDGDSNAALSVLSAMMFGLAHQRRTGEGQHISMSMLGGNALCYSDDFCTYRDKPARPVTDENNYGLNALYRLYQVRDGWVFLAAPTQQEWIDLVKTLGLSEVAADQRFATAEARAANDDALATELSSVLASRGASELETLLSTAGVGCAIADEGGSSAFTSTDPVLYETGLTLDVDHPLFGRIRRHAPPIVFSETPGRVGPSCLRGEHTRSVLAGLGYSASEIEALERTGAVFGPG